MEHNGVPFKYVTGDAMAVWCTLTSGEMLNVWNTQVEALGLTQLPAWRENHDGPQDKSVFSLDVDAGDLRQLSKKLVMLYAESIEWLCTMDNVAQYTEICRDVSVTKECRGVFRVKFTVYLYGPKGG